MINLTINTQPTDETCGPTCLHAIYRYYGLDISLDEVIHGVKRSLSGGTLGALLGNHALKQGFKVTIYVSNVRIFDPTWFKKSGAPREVLISKLKGQEKFKHSKQLRQVSNAFIEFLELGGNIRFKTLDVKTFREYFDKDIPIITGLSSTYLYRCSRECFTAEGDAFFDDLKGEPCGHFVVLSGYSDKKTHLIVADPFRANPFTKTNYYRVTATRTINAIMMGALTYDAVLLIIHP